MTTPATFIGRAEGLDVGPVFKTDKNRDFLDCPGSLALPHPRASLPQDQSYHSFADRRTLLGIPNFWDVVSRLPFAVIGLIGLFVFRDFATRVLFLGIFFTASGSAYYHLSPDDARLFWDRLPMTVAFMALFALAIKQRGLVVPLVMVGVMSIVWWSISGNLWPLWSGPIRLTGRALRDLVAQ